MREKTESQIQILYFCHKNSKNYQVVYFFVFFFIFIYRNILWVLFFFFSEQQQKQTQPCLAYLVFAGVKFLLLLPIPHLLQDKNPKRLLKPTPELYLLERNNLCSNKNCHGQLLSDSNEPLALVLSATPSPGIRTSKGRYLMEFWVSDSKEKWRSESGRQGSG